MNKSFKIEGNKGTLKPQGAGVDLKFEEEKYKKLLKQIQARLESKRLESTNILKSYQTKAK